MLGHIHRDLRTQRVATITTRALSRKGDLVNTGYLSTRDINPLLEQQCITSRVERVGPRDTTNHLHSHGAGIGSDCEVGAAGEADHREGATTTQREGAPVGNTRGVNGEGISSFNVYRGISSTCEHSRDACISSLEAKPNITCAIELENLNASKIGKIAIPDGFAAISWTSDFKNICPAATNDRDNGV